MKSGKDCLCLLLGLMFHTHGVPGSLQSGYRDLNLLRCIFPGTLKNKQKTWGSTYLKARSFSSTLVNRSNLCSLFWFSNLFQDYRHTGSFLCSLLQAVKKFWNRRISFLTLFPTILNIVYYSGFLEFLCFRICHLFLICQLGLWQIIWRILPSVVYSMNKQHVIPPISCHVGSCHVVLAGPELLVLLELLPQPLECWDIF